MTLAIETDILDIFVSFIKNTEFTDCDLITFLDQTQNVLLDLDDLDFEEGQTNNMVTRIVSRDLSHIEGG